MRIDHNASRTDTNCVVVMVHKYFGWLVILNIADQETSMFINITYKDAPELSTARRRSSDMDTSVEKTLLVNPNCPVRIMLEYIRKRCRLGTFAQFDLCDESGVLMGLFNLPTYIYATDRFEHKKTYYLVIIRQEFDKRITVIPQLNHENMIYEDLRTRVKHYLATGEASPAPTVHTPTPPGKVTPPGKATPSGAKPLAKKK